MINFCKQLEPDLAPKDVWPDLDLPESDNNSSQHLTGFAQA